METTNIYILVDPRNDLVRYVGKANNISQRYRAHKNKARKEQQHKRNWVALLKREGLKPAIEVIDVIQIGEWKFWEKYWISQFRVWGFDLLNYTVGGDGLTFGNSTSFKKGNGTKKVIGFNKELVKVYEFKSTSDATKIFNVNKGSISACCGEKGNAKTIKGIAWFYEDNIRNLTKLELDEKINRRFTKIYPPNSGQFKKGTPSLHKQKIGMYSLDDKLLKIFDCVGDAAKYVRVTNSAIQFACLKSKKHICKQFKWKYEK